MAAGDSASTNEDQAVTIDVVANDTDPDSDPLTVQSVSDPADGTATDNGDGTIAYAPDPDTNGTDTFTYTISDGNGGTDTATVTVDVTPVNDPPSATDDSVATDEDQQLTFNVLTNDADPDTSDTLSVQSISDPPNGTTTDNGDGTVTYSPDANFNGTDSFTYTVADGAGATDTATVTITVTPVNDDPVASDDSYTVQILSTLNVPAPGVLANDNDVEDDPLTVTNTDPAAGTVTMNADGSFTYDAPLVALPLPDTFTYTVGDGNGGSDTATVTITVQPLPVTSDTFYFSGLDSGGGYQLQNNPPPTANPEPDHDSDGEYGLTINASDGELNEPDTKKYQHWTHTFSANTTYSGQVRLELYSAVEGLDENDATGHYHVYLHDCDSSGNNCVQILETDQHIKPWGTSNGWVFKDLSLGSVDHTFSSGRMLRVRLMFKHEDMWVAMSGDRPTQIIFQD